MGLQFDSDVFYFFLATITYLLGGILALRYYLRTKYTVAFSFAMAYLIGALGALGNGIAEMLLEPEILVLADLILIPMGFFYAYTSDCVQHEKLDMKKIIMVAGVSGAYLFAATQPGTAYHSVNEFGDPVVKWMGWFDMIGSLLFLLSIIFVTILVFRINQQAKFTTDLKRPARWLWLTVVFYIITVATVTIPLSEWVLFAAAGMFIIIYIFFTHPKLLFILPFKPLRLTVLDNASGLPVFTHTWKLGTSMADETLFAGMLQGISLIVKESMNRGELRELSLSQGILLFSSSEESPITCALAATQSSKTLRDALAGFHDRFLEQFEVPLKTPEYLDPFHQADELVEICFPFVPEYERKVE